MTIRRYRWQHVDGFALDRVDCLAPNGQSVGCVLEGGGGTYCAFIPGSYLSWWTCDEGRARRHVEQRDSEQLDLELGEPWPRWRLAADPHEDRVEYINRAGDVVGCVTAAEEGFLARAGGSWHAWYESRLEAMRAVHEALSGQP